MRKTKTITLEAGGYVTIKEITPANWNVILSELGDDVQNMTIEKAIQLGPEKIKTLAGDTVEFDGVFDDLGYSALIEIWMAWRGVSESFLALLDLTREKCHPGEPVVNVAESKQKVGKKGKQ